MSPQRKFHDRSTKVPVIFRYITYHNVQLGLIPATGKEGLLLTGGLARKDILGFLSYHKLLL